MDVHLVQATPADIDDLAHFERAAYGDAAVPLENLREWHAVDPAMFRVLRGPHGERHGHLNLLRIRPGPLARLLAGEIVEADLAAGDLFSASEREMATSLYIESIAVENVEPQSRSPAVRAILLHFIDAAGLLDPVGKVEEIHAMAATAAGARFLTRLGLKEIGSTGFYAGPYATFIEGIGRSCYRR